MEQAVSINEKEVMEAVQVTARQVPDVVRSDSEANLVGEALNQLAGLRKRVKEYIDPVVEAAHKAHQEAVALRKKLLGPIEEVEARCRRLLSEYQAAKEAEFRRRQAEELAKLKAQVTRATRKGDTEAVAMVATQMEAVASLKPEAAGGVKYRTVWKWRLVDLSRVPREYLRVDEGKVNEVVRMLKGETKIPGIEVYEEKVTVV